MTKLADSPEEVGLLEHIEATIKIMLTILTELDLQTAQNVFFGISRKTYPRMREKAQSGDPAAQKWIEHFSNLAHYLGVIVQ